MSHFTRMEVCALQKNESELIASLKSHFGENSVEVVDPSRQLMGYDSRANKKANVIVSQDAIRKSEKSHAYNELGFERTKTGGYELHYDAMDIKKPSLDKVMQDYAERVATKTMKAKGFTMKREAQKDGTVKLSFSRFA